VRGFTETAQEIGRRLASEAIWHEGRCCWIGPFPDMIGARTVVHFRSLPPDLYSGTAGVALALAEIDAITGESACRRTAVGAMRQALAGAEDAGSALEAGLYSGLAGIAVAAIRSGLLLGTPELVERGRGLADRAVAECAAGDSYDLISGRAGVVLGLLAIAHALSDSAAAAAAVGLGEQLVAAAKRRGAWSWPRVGAGSGLMATGMSHGGAGAACSLLELGEFTGDERFLVAAEGARASEEACFDEAAGNWPASQEADGHGHAELTAISEVSWCHGAPGIAMARHRAWMLTGDSARRAEAELALETTAAWVRAALSSRRGNFSLCHGLAGNAEALMDAADAAGPRASRLRSLALEVAESGVAEHATGVRPWPCGPGGEAPGLMIGLAGIARYYLRLEVPDLPSLLVPCPADAWGSV
jgi:lantibiotic modifying enzyme